MWVLLRGTQLVRALGWAKLHSQCLWRWCVCVCVCDWAREAKRSGEERQATRRMKQSRGFVLLVWLLAFGFCRGAWAVDSASRLNSVPILTGAVLCEAYIAVKQTQTTQEKEEKEKEKEGSGASNHRHLSFPLLVSSLSLFAFLASLFSLLCCETCPPPPPC